MPRRQTIYKLIYNSNLNYILRSINYSFKSVLPKRLRIPPSGIMTIFTETGAFKMATNQTSYLTQLLFWNGYKSFEYSELFERLSKDVDTFLDIGANIGYYSLLGISSNPNLTAYAFEPALGPKYFLKKNIAINNVHSQLKHVDVALSNQNGHIEFYEVANKKYTYLDYNLAGEGNAGTKTESRHFVKNEVASQTLDHFVSKQQLRSIDLIKMDTEGTEVDIIKSGIDAIKTYQPIIICETLFNTIEDELEAIFQSLDYHMYNHTEDGLVKVESIKRVTDDGVRNCFFVPESKLELISKFVV